MTKLTGNHLEQRRLARSVGTNERDLFAAPNIEIEILVDMLLAEGLRDPLDMHDVVTGTRGLRKDESHLFLFLGNLDSLDALEFLDAVLHLFGLRRLVPKLLDESLHVRNLAVLGLLHRNQAGKCLIALDEIGIVIARVDADLAIGDISHVVDHAIHEGAVMAYDEYGATIGLEEVLEPAHALEVEVIGGLVKQQNLRCPQEELGKCNAHLPATGELIGRALHILFMKAQAKEHTSCLGLDVVTVLGLEARAQATVLREKVIGARFICALHLALKSLEALSELCDIGDTRHDFLEDAASLHFDGFLLEVSWMSIARKDDLAGIGGLKASDDVHERRLACPVRTDEGIAIALVDAKRDIREENACTE